MGGVESTHLAASATTSPEEIRRGTLEHLCPRHHLAAPWTRSPKRKPAEGNHDLEEHELVATTTEPSRGARHARRFCPALDVERHITNLAGDDWVTAAQDRSHWKNLEFLFVQAHDPPWASGKQPSLANLAPTPGRGRYAPRGGQGATEYATLTNGSQQDS